MGVDYTNVLKYKMGYPKSGKTN